MATAGKAGGKRQVYFSLSTGLLGKPEINSPSSWNPGKHNPKKKKISFGRPNRKTGI